MLKDKALFKSVNYFFNQRAMAWHKLDVCSMGGVHGIAQILEDAIGLDKPKKNKIGKLISWSIVFIFCNLAWVLFRADNFRDALYVMCHVFVDLTDFSSYLHTNIGLTMSRLLYIVIVILVISIYDFLSLKKDVLSEFDSRSLVIRLIVEYGIVICIGYALYNSTGLNQFVYFQF